jgi:hypothetical protein
LDALQNLQTNVDTVAAFQLQLMGTAWWWRTGSAGCREEVASRTALAKLIELVAETLTDSGFDDAEKVRQSDRAKNAF